MVINATEKTQKNAKYSCESCQYKTDNKTEYYRHILTRKHENATKCYINATKNTCDCGKTFKHHSSFYRHKKTCKIDEIEKNNNTNTPNNLDTLQIIANLFQEQLKENKELKDLIVEQNKQLLEFNSKEHGTTNITNNNKTKFNMNFFLNEKCKDALNLMDFVNDLQIQLTDLENVGRLGYTEGISRIFINGLKQLDVSKRPIHCSDVKREVLYIKDQDAWEKENEENKKIKKAIHHISSKNIKQIQKWTECHPHYKESDSKQNDQYLQILCESMGSSEPANLEKVIRNIAKEVVIDK
jgi:hypothetical protein